MIRVRALGASEIQIGRKKITLGAEVVFALGLYLCTRAGERLTRDDVAAVFWGDVSEAQRRHSLRQMLYRLRQHGLTLDEDSEELFLHPSRVESDLATALSEGWVATADAAAVESAASLVPGFTRPISPRFQQWLDSIRDRLAAQHRRAALRQIAMARREGRWADLDKWALQVLLSDPLNEEATLARAESAAMAGSKAVALEIIDAYLEELGERSAQIGLPASILRRRIAERRPDWIGRGPREVPLVGRAELMARLTALVDAAGRGEGSAVVLWGAPGIGKTRLAEEARGYAELKGFRTVFVRATVASASRPLSLVLALLPLVRALPGAMGADPAALDILDAITRRDAQPLDPESGTNVASMREALLSSIEDLMDAVSTEQRLLISLDDAHNVDDVSSEILQELSARTSEMRLLWVSTSRSRSVLSAQARGRARSTPRHIHVPALERTEAIEFAQAIRGQFGGRAHNVDCAAVAAAAGGNPLFVRELSAHGAATLAKTLPVSLTELMQTRLEQMDADPLRVLRATTLLGNFASIARVRALFTGVPLAFADAVEQLECEGILTLTGQHALDLHDCWRQAVTRGMRGASQASLSYECASTLLATERASEDANLSWLAADLLVAAGEARRAVALISQCGEHMIAVGFPLESAAIFSRALTLAHGDELRVHLLAQLARAQHSAAHLSEAISSCTAAICAYSPATLGQSIDYALAVALRADSLSKMNLDPSADVSELARLASNPDLPPEAKHFVCLTGVRLAAHDANSPLETLFFEESSRTSAIHGWSTTGSLVALVYNAERGNNTETLAAEKRLADREHEPAPVGFRCRVLRYRSTARRMMGDAVGSAALADRAHDLAESYGLWGDVAAVAELMTFTSLDRQDKDSADIWLGRWAVARPHFLHPEREFATAHALSLRLLLDEKYAEALALLESQLERLLGDPFQKRRGVALATIALCAAACRRLELSARCFEHTMQIVEGNRPSHSVDFMVELLLRSCDFTRQPELKAQIGRTYALRRLSMSGAALPPLNQNVREAMEKLRREA